MMDAISPFEYVATPFVIVGLVLFAISVGFQIWKR